MNTPIVVRQLIHRHIHVQTCAHVIEA